MKTNFKKLPGSKIELEVILSKDEFRPYWDTAHEHALANVHLKGFRPGTAPKELAEKAIDKDKVFEEAARDAIRVNLDEAVKDNEWTLIDAPKIEILPSLDSPSLSRRGGETPDLSFKFKATLAVFPEVKLGNYKKIAKKAVAESEDRRKKIKVEPAELEKSLDWLRGSRAKVALADRVARKGDLVDIDLESSVDSFKGEKFVLGQGRFIPGFEDNLENRKAGESLEFSLTAPRDYWNEKLRGQNLQFKVKINGVYERILPELNDEFAQSLSQTFKKIDDLKNSISEGLRQEKESKETGYLRAKIMDDIIKDSEIDIPEVMAEKTLDSMVKDYKQMTQTAGKKEEEIREQLRDRAKNNVAGNLVLYKIARLENLEPTKEEIENEAKEKNLDAEKFYDYIYGVILNKKVFNFLGH